MPPVLYLRLSARVALRTVSSFLPKSVSLLPAQVAALPTASVASSSASDSMTVLLTRMIMRVSGWRLCLFVDARSDCTSEDTLGCPLCCLLHHVGEVKVVRKDKL